MEMFTKSKKVHSVSTNDSSNLIKNNDPYADIHEFSLIELDINPKNVKFLLIDKDDEFKLKIEVIVKICFNSLKVKDGDTAELFEPTELFNRHHYPGVPEILGLDGISEMESGPPKIKKVMLTSRLYDGKSADSKVYTDRLAQLINNLTVAYNGKFFSNGKKVEGSISYEKEAVKKSETNDLSEEKKKKIQNIDIELGRYQMTQMLVFSIPMSYAMTSTSSDFPYDSYDIKLGFNMKPTLMYKFYNNENDIESKQKIQLLLEFVKSFKNGIYSDMSNISKPSVPSFKISKKDNFYHQLIVKPWPKIASSIVGQDFGAFDMMPFSLSIKTPRFIENFHRIRSEKYYETAFFITFSIVRLVTQPVITVMVPLWLCMIMQTFVYFFQNASVDGAYAYLVTLLIAVIQHRQTIDSYESHVSGVTSADFQFFCVIVVTSIQMFLLQFLKTQIVENQLVAFFSHGAFVVILILRDLIFTYRQYCLLIYSPEFTTPDPRLEKNVYNVHAISLKQYSKLVRYKNILHMTINEMMSSKIRSKFTFDRKSYLSFNLKWLCRQDIPNDLFRWRGKETTFFPPDVDMKPLYKKLNKKGFHKEVFNITVKNSNILFEVQYLPDNFNPNKDYDAEHSKHKIASFWKLHDTSLTTYDLTFLLLKSVWFELFELEFRHIWNDFVLYYLALSVLKSDSDSEKAPEKVFFYDADEDTSSNLK